MFYEGDIEHYAFLYAGIGEAAGNDNVFTIGSDSFQKDFWICLNVTAQKNLSSLVEDVKIHISDTQIDVAGKFVLLGVKSHLRPPCER